MTERKAKNIVATFLVFFLSGLVYADEITETVQSRLHFRATVLKVIDGDTLDVRYDKIIERVRIYGINAPERGEPYYKAAKIFTARMTQGKRVKLLTRGRGRYGRLLAFILVGDKSLGLELVKNGLARVYSNGFAPDYPPTYERYKKAQIHAMTGNLGIWKGRKK